MLIAVRLFGGLFFASTNVIKTLVGEVTDKTNQVQAFGYILLSWGVGRFLGPLIGGYLIYPHKNYPEFFEKYRMLDFLKDYPFLLPNIIFGLLTIFGLLVSFIWMPETLKVKKNPIKPMYRKITLFVNKRYKKDQQGEYESLISNDGAEEQPVVEPPKPKQPSILKNKLILLTIFLYASGGIIFGMFDEAWIIWTIVPKIRGGLAFTSKELGISGSIGGICVIVIHVFAIIKLVSRKFGLINIFRTGYVLCIGSFFMIPTLNYIVSPTTSNVVFWVITGTVLVIKNFGGQFIFTHGMTFINNCTTQANKASSFGLSQTIFSILKFLGPMISSNIVAWSLEPGHPFPINHYFVFVIISVISIVPLILTLYLPPSVNTPLVEPKITSVEDLNNNNDKDNSNINNSDIVKVDVVSEDCNINNPNTTYYQAINNSNSLVVKKGIDEIDDL
eukprot:gene5643-7025_t